MTEHSLRASYDESVHAKPTRFGSGKVFYPSILLTVLIGGGVLGFLAKNEADAQRSKTERTNQIFNQYALTPNQKSHINFELFEGAQNCAAVRQDSQKICENIKADLQQEQILPNSP